MKKPTEQALKSITLFECCDRSFLKKMAEKSVILTCDKGKNIFFSNDPAERFYFIIDGWVKLYRETAEGTQAIIDVINAHKIFGDTAIFHNDTYAYSAETIEKAHIISMPLSVLKQEINNNPDLAVMMMKTMARYNQQQDQEIENRTLKSAPQRIGCFLLRLIGTKTSGQTVIHLPYDKTLIAARLGMQPETFSRAMNKLKASIQIEVNGCEIVVHDIKELTHYACSHCSSHFPCEDLAHNTSPSN